MVNKCEQSDNDTWQTSSLLYLSHIRVRRKVVVLSVIIIIIIITNEKIKVMLSRKHCKGTLQDYNKGEISKCQSKLWTNRNVFSWCLNGKSDETVRRDGGRVFHARGAATGKARLSRVDLCTGGTTSVVDVDDRRWRRLSTSAVRRMFSARYAGADPLRQWCVRTQRRNVFRSGTRSQWSSRRSGVMRSERADM